MNTNPYSTEDLEKILLRIPEPTVPIVLQLILLASDYEIYGMVLLEAMFFSNAVISTPTAGAIDLVDKSVGVLVEEKSAETWATQIKHLVSHPAKLKQMQNNAKTLVQQNLTWDSVAENYDNEVLSPSINRINLTK